MGERYDDIRNRLTLHQIRLLRLGRSWSRKFLSEIDHTEADLRFIVETEIGPLLQSKQINFASPEVRKRVKRLRRRVEDVRGAAFDEAVTKLTEDLGDLLDEEAAFALLLIKALGLEPVEPKSRTSLTTIRSVPAPDKDILTWMDSIREGDVNRIVATSVSAVNRDDGRFSAMASIFGSANQTGVVQVTRAATEAAILTGIVALTSEVRRLAFAANSTAFSDEVWVSVLDHRTTPQCRALSGQRFPVGEGPRPPIHVRCRSIRVPVPRGETIDEVTYDEWLRKQSRQDQEEILGPTRAALFRDGGLTVDRFVADDLNTLTLDELFRREEDAFRRAGLSIPRIRF